MRQKVAFILAGVEIDVSLQTRIDITKSMVISHNLRHLPLGTIKRATLSVSFGKAS